MSGSTPEFWVNPVNLPYCKTETNMTKRTLSCTRQSLSSVAPVMVSGLPRLFSIVCDHLQHLQPSLKPFSLHSRSSRSSRCSSFYFFFCFLRFFRANDCALAVINANLSYARPLCQPQNSGQNSCTLRLSIQPSTQ